MATKMRSVRNNTSAKLNPGVPNQTLYCTNLPDKIPKEDLRRSLYMLFSSYGPVLDVVALKTMKMRGQAHIVFRDIQASTQAMNALQNFDFFGKNMRIVYAKGKSDIVAKLAGIRYTPPAATSAAMTGLQQSIFNAPPSSVPPSNVKSIDQNHQDATSEVGSAHGQKRPRDDESDEGAPMEEDSDAPMEDSSSEEE
ncbi:MAG: U2 snRNP complex subunit msl1 [Cirrosporium novae-zelandiae]|nr:MAG: U2 snRNP complex subunit msl1 [Cirrosporium novae-zelandiae]